MRYTEQNITHLFDLIGNYPGAELQLTEHYKSIGVQKSVWPNQLWAMRRGTKSAAGYLDFLEQALAENRIPGLAMGNPAKDDKDLLQEARNRQYKIGSWTAMCHDLTSLKKLPTLANFEIRKVIGRDELKTWLNLANTELMGAERLNEGLFEFLVHSDQCSFYLGFEGNQAVATAMLFEHNGLGGICLVSTKSGFRQRGYGAQITQACLMEAKSRGLERIEIQATTLGKGVYASLGFSDEGEIPVFRINQMKS
ncbi:MAG: GNAT family N-acetyltransferase [Bacteroidetes bacterium]|nr:MAG: GNAT family N-acetyltransferase [Bacteroidota bacterium]